MRSQTEIRNLISLSIDMLHTMILPSSLFCFDRIKGQKSPRGVSARYTVIALLGIIKAMKAGYDVGLDVSKIWQAALSEIGSAGITAGDIGLYLWLDSELKGENTTALLHKLESSVEARGGWATYLGMDIAWITIGAVSAARRSGSSAAVKILRNAVESIYSHYVSDSGLLYHFGKSTPRRRFPDFATQIYNVYALSHAAEFLGDDRPLTVSRQIADKLLALQLPCGGWPWLYDATRGSVVERYEIFSVHQDGMAPMSLLKLSEVSGKEKYARAAFAGLDWLYSNNELNFHMIDEKAALIYRSVRRRKPFNRLIYATNIFLSILGTPSDLGKGRFLEINPTCRPYHLGWILFAWSGKESSFGGVPT
jgi:hypothetical protein